MTKAGGGGGQEQQQQLHSQGRPFSCNPINSGQVIASAFLYDLMPPDEVGPFAWWLESNIKIP